MPRSATWRRARRATASFSRTRSSLPQFSSHMYRPRRSSSRIDINHPHGSLRLFSELGLRDFKQPPLNYLSEQVRFGVGRSRPLTLLKVLPVREFDDLRDYGKILPDVCSIRLWRLQKKQKSRVAVSKYKQAPLGAIRRGLQPEIRARARCKVRPISRQSSCRERIGVLG